MKVNGYEIKPKADLSGADLAGADLAGARLGRANLEGANLEGANLSAAKLKNAKLEGANLASAILPLADLEEAVLDGACLTDAVLCGANLSFAWLHRANLTRADLRYALLQTTRLTEANLTGAVLTGSVFQPTFDNFVIADETTVWPAGFDPEVAWARGAVIQTSDDDPGGVSGISREFLLKMEDYIRARNSPERLQRVELVAQYVMETEGDQGEDELTMSKYHLSTDGGTEDLKRLYPEALAWAFGELEQGRYEFGRFFPDGSINLQDPLLADSYGQTVEHLRRLFPADSGESAEGDVSGEAEEMRTESDDGGERAAGVFVGEHGEVFVDLVRELYGDSEAERAADMVDETDLGADLGPLVTEFIRKVHGLDYLIDEVRGTDGDTP